jgi:predicted regulator of Ras-like GTPase activity (Roadblock/LC7/MglB family)
MLESPPFPRGFQGAVSSLPLVDVIQLQAGNRFSGLITVSSNGNVGRLYFLDGAIVHAATPDAVGESAVYAIVGWPEGSFQLHPNTTTIERSIEKNVSLLLLEAHQFLDESRHRVRPPAPPLPSAPSARSAPSAGGSFVDRVRGIAGVEEVVRFGRDGVPIGDASPQAEALAARGLYLVMTHAAAVSAAFGLGELTSISLRSETEPLLLFQSQGHFLCVTVGASTAIEDVEARIRAFFTRPAAR